MAEIRNFDELIQDYIGPHKIILEKQSSYLLIPGENYLSDMKKIHVTLKNEKTGTKEYLDLVAKCCIETELGTTFSIMKNEINFYKIVIPALKKFQKKHGGPPITFFPEFVGGRLNLTGSEEADYDAVLLQKNMKVEGYEMQDRHVGFNLATTKVILRDLAIHHATTLALKLSEPEIFKSDIKDQCNFGPSTAIKGDDETTFHPDLPNFFPVIGEYVQSSKELSHVYPAFEKLHIRAIKFMKVHRHFMNPPIKEPFCTLLHADLWINNIMLKVQKGVVVGNIFVDFQMYRLGSPAVDLIFFLISSVQYPILKNEFDNLIKYYYEVFSDVLKKYDCYGPQFSYDKFLEELAENAEPPIVQCMLMLPMAVFSQKGARFGWKDPQIKSEDLPELAIEKISFLLLEAYKREWLV